MRWQRVARFIVAALGLGVAVLIYTRFDRKPPPPKAPTPEALPPGATFVSHLGGGQQCRYQDGREVSCLSYNTFATYADGHREILKPRYHGDRAGRPFTISADRGVLKPADANNSDPNQLPEETQLYGNVLMHEEDGMELTGAEATFHESSGILDIPVAMQFKNGRLSGSGVGASYNRNQQTIDLRDQAVISIAPDTDGLGRLDGRSQQLFLNRESHILNMTGDVAIARDHETMHSNTSEMRLTDDNQGVQTMEMRGQSTIVPVGNGGSTPEMRSDDMHLEFLPDGRTIHRALLVRGASMVLVGAGKSRRQISGDNLDATLAADGQRVTTLNGDGAPLTVRISASGNNPDRTITSQQMTTQGNERDGLTSATFTDPKSVDFREAVPASGGKPAVDRHVYNARKLTLALNGGDFGDIRDATFEVGTKFTNNDTSGSADDVTYFARENRLELRVMGKGTTPLVKTPRIVIDAPSIDIDLNKTEVQARGGVHTVTVADPKATSRGLFDETKPVTGTAQTLKYADADNAATYAGGTKLWQGDGKDRSEIVADQVVVNNTDGSLHATGKVSVRLPIENVGEQGQAPPKADANAFDYDDKKRQLVYTGGGKAGRVDFVGPDGQVKANKLTITLASDSHELQTMLAEGDVAARIAADESAFGKVLNYAAATGVYVLDGPPSATLINKKSEDGRETCTATYAEQLTFKKSDTTNSNEGGATAGKTGVGQKTVTLADCQQWIIK